MATTTHLVKLGALQQMLWQKTNVIITIIMCIPQSGDSCRVLNYQIYVTRQLSATSAAGKASPRKCSNELSESESDDGAADITIEREIARLMREYRECKEAATSGLSALRDKIKSNGDVAEPPSVKILKRKNDKWGRKSLELLALKSWKSSSSKIGQYSGQKKLKIEGAS